jgi:hypothetical protein
LSKSYSSLTVNAQKPSIFHCIAMDYFYVILIEMWSFS